MLICNNCGCIHQQQVTICTQCRIPGDFTVTPDIESGNTAIDTIMCINCGNHIGADLHRCPECRFPQTKQSRQHHRGEEQNPFRRDRKTG